LLDDLSDEAKARLAKLQSEISYDKLTVGFSIEARDADGIKRWAQQSLTVSRKGDESWSEGDMPLIHALMSKAIVNAVYLDVFARKVLPPGDVKDELRKVIDNYDLLLIRLFEKEKANGS